MKTTRFEHDAEYFLTGEKLTNFLAFGNFLTENKITKTASSKPSTKHSCWSPKHKKKTVCHFRAWRDGWFVSFFRGVDINLCEPFITDEMKEYMLTHINTKPGCGSCKGNPNRIIFGQKFDIVCGCNLIMFVNPTGHDMERIRSLVLATKNAIDAYK
ncbi:MAG: hypothetical protein FWC71_02110 [Defluviitaleaceae bacterium]|nr:hypothetical protein [Defluviitaleaceae bacterium]